MPVSQSLFNVSNPERVILTLLIAGRINSTDAQLYLTNLDYWRSNFTSYLSTYPNMWVGVSNGQVFPGTSFSTVSDAIFAANPNARPYVGFVQA